MDDETDIWPAGIMPAWGYKRRASNPVATMAEASLATRFGWRLAVLRGQQAVGILRSTGAFDVVGARAFLDRQEAVPNYLAVSEWMRFGNAVRQMTNVFYVADRYGVRHIEFPSNHAILSGNRVNDVELTWQPTLETADRRGLRGAFYYLQGLNLAPAAKDKARIARTCIRPLVSSAATEPRGDVKSDDLVLHFRAGDVFDANPAAVHPFYGQPPLAYYLGAVEREKPSRVWLVYEDRGNPCIAATESLLKGRGVEVVLQSTSLIEDVRLLLSAARIVAGRGSFIPAVAALSSRLKKLYLFGPPLSALQLLGVTQIEGIDTVGRYREKVLSSNWRALPEQRALMLAYPMTAIGFIEHPANA